MGLSFIDRMKRQLELAADTTNVRLSQTRDHLIWKATYKNDVGESYDVVSHIYFLEDDRNTVLEIYPNSYFRFDGYDDETGEGFEDGIDHFFADIERRKG